MARSWTDLTRHWEDWVNFALGAWIAVSPWILDFALQEPARWNHLLVGTLVCAVALLAIAQFQIWEEWVNLACGAWLLASPWLLGFADTAAALWNAVVAGALVGLLALLELWDEQRHQPNLPAGAH